MLESAVGCGMKFRCCAECSIGFLGSDLRFWAGRDDAAAADFRFRSVFAVAVDGFGFVVAEVASAAALAFATFDAVGFFPEGSDAALLGWFFTGIGFFRGAGALITVGAFTANLYPFDNISSLE